MQGGNISKITINIYTTIIVLFVGLIIFSKMSFAHEAEAQPEFFKINQEYAQKNTIINTSPIGSFPIPKFISPQNYLINENLVIEIVPSVLTDHELVFQKAHFYWDFGDGEWGEGIKTSHTYQYPGSYILNIYGKLDEYEQPVPFKSLLINVLPYIEYKLPEAVLKINGNAVSDAPTKLSFSDELAFDGTASTSYNSKIVSYSWNFGDQNISFEPKTKHKFNQADYNSNLVLRVKDENNLYKDAFVELINSDPKPPGLIKEKGGLNIGEYIKIYSLILSVLGLLSIAGVLAFIKKRM